jgi:hypothetical protein
MPPNILCFVSRQHSPASPRHRTIRQLYLPQRTSDCKFEAASSFDLFSLSIFLLIRYGFQLDDHDAAETRRRQRGAPNRIHDDLPTQ